MLVTSAPRENAFLNSGATALHIVSTLTPGLTYFVFRARRRFIITSGRREATYKTPGLYILTRCSFSLQVHSVPLCQTSESSSKVSVGMVFLFHFVQGLCILYGKILKKSRKILL